MKRIIILLAVLLLLTGCPAQNGDVVDNPDITEEPEKEMPESQDAIFFTEDGVQLKGVIWRHHTPEKGIVLLHMVGNEKEDYFELAPKLQEAGYGVLAFDFRGHGESSGGSYMYFSDEDWANLEMDVKAAVKLMKHDGYESIGLVGASIGANLALRYAVGDEIIESVVLLSPGDKFRGVSTEGVASGYDEPVFLAAALDDEYSSATVTKIHNELAGEKKLEIFELAGHGTNMFAAEPGLYDMVIDWFTTTMP